MTPVVDPGTAELHLGKNPFWESVLLGSAYTLDMTISSKQGLNVGLGRIPKPSRNRIVIMPSWSSAVPGRNPSIGLELGGPRKKSEIGLELRDPRRRLGS